MLRVLSRGPLGQIDLCGYKVNIPVFLLQWESAIKTHDSPTSNTHSIHFLDISRTMFRPVDDTNSHPTVLCALMVELKKEERISLISASYQCILSVQERKFKAVFLFAISILLHILFTFFKTHRVLYLIRNFMKLKHNSE